MAAMPIDAKAKDFLLRAQHRSMTETYRRDYPNARWEVIELDGEPVGRLVTDVGNACVTYVDIAILPAGAGTRAGAARHAAGSRGASAARPARPGQRAHAQCRLVASSANVSGLCVPEESPPFVRLEWTA